MENFPVILAPSLSPLGCWAISANIPLLMGVVISLSIYEGGRKFEIP